MSAQAAWLNRLKGTAMAGRLMSGPGYRVRTTRSGGHTIEVLAVGGGEDQAVEQFPFQIMLSPSMTDEQAAAAEPGAAAADVQWRTYRVRSGSVYRNLSPYRFPVEGTDGADDEQSDPDPNPDYDETIDFVVPWGTLEYWVWIDNQDPEHPAIKHGDTEPWLAMGYTGKARSWWTDDFYFIGRIDSYTDREKQTAYAYQFQRTDVWPVVGQVWRMRIKEVHGDYLTCVPYDGSHEGPECTVDKPPELKHSVSSESIEGSTVSYSYATRADNLDGKRTASGAGPDQTEIIIPVYKVDDEILAVRNAIGSSYEWCDLNRDARAWCQVGS